QHSAEAALESLSVFNPDVVLTDNSLPGMIGLEQIRVLQEQLPQTKIIMMTGYGNIEDAVAAMKAGAFHYLTKPVVLSELLLLLDKCRQAQGMERQLSFYQQRESRESGLQLMIGESPAMRTVKDPHPAAAGSGAAHERR